MAKKTKNNSKSSTPVNDVPTTAGKKKAKGKRDKNQSQKMTKGPSNKVIEQK